MDDTSTQIAVAATEDPFWTVPQIDMRRRMENQCIGKPYPYDDWALVWDHHRRVAHWSYGGRTPETIARLCNLDVMTVRRILNHPPVAAWIEYMKERLRVCREKADEAKAETAEKAFDVIREIVIGDAKPEKTRLDACKVAISIDPHGRYEPYDPVNDRAAPLGTDEWRDFIENKSVIDVEAVVIEPDEESET